jgi:hypothetical protein
MDGLVASAVHRKQVNLTLVVTACLGWSSMVGIRASGLESHHARDELPALALNTEDAVPVIDEQVVPRVLTEWNGNGIARFVQCQHHRERRPVTDVLGMFHDPSVACCSGGQRL